MCLTFWVMVPQVSRRSLTLAALTVLLLTGHAHAQQVVAYVFPQESTLAPAQIDAAKLTRILYAFANVRDGQVVNGFAHDDRNLATLTSLRTAHPRLQVLVSVGGWTWSGQFSDAALTPASRARFADSALAFVRKYDLDGLDIDWEYPGQAGAGNTFRAEDRDNYTLLLQTLHDRFAADTGRAPHRRPLVLTIAAGSNAEWLAHTRMAEVARAVDNVNLMAYDYYEPDSDTHTGNHAPLFTDPADPKHVSADSSVQAMEAAGVPAAKLLLGIPFYGHGWAGVSPVNHGLFQPGTPSPATYLTYAALTHGDVAQGATRFWDSAASVPYLYNPTTKLWVSYEDKTSVRSKCEYVRTHHLGGVMFWDYAGDPAGELISVMDQVLGEKP